MTDSNQDSNSVLKFVAFESFLDGGFWPRLAKNKLEVYRLDENSVPIKAYYENSYADGLPCRISVDFNAFDPDAALPDRCFPLNGNVLVTNTIEKFRDIDKQELINSLGSRIISNIKSGAIWKNPCLLNEFFLLVYADLKQHIFYYWFAFPALSSQSVICLDQQPIRIDEYFTPEQLSEFLSKYDSFRQSDQSCAYFTVSNNSNSELNVSSLDNYDLKHSNTQLLSFCDPATSLEYPGWPLRNLLIAVASRINKPQQILVLCYRERIKDGIRYFGHSLILKLTLSPVADWNNIQTVGWEKNAKGKLLPRIANLKSAMDPERLAESAAELNLKLMRWRLMPELDLDKIKSTRCLLLGSGTLGCNVARQLLAWGVKRITMVDNSRVSYSNPVRQSLFRFADSVEGGRLKSEAAADALRAIYPSVVAFPYTLSIPMPGHCVTGEAEISKVKDDCKLLETLILENDVVFLLLDTREARWLPSLLANVHSKVVINAALGFDTYLVMRHGFAANGISPGLASAQSQLSIDSSNTGDKNQFVNIPGNELGCYFCNDVVGPANSTRDRSLDQQCTVTRPGVSMIASALAVELMVSLVQHKDGPLAAADSCQDTYPSRCELGLAPHQIRGFLSRFTEVLPCTRAFNQCCACSQTVLDAYRKDGFEFLIKAFNDPDCLETLTGLKKLQMDTCIDEVIAMSDEEMSL